MKIVNDEGSIDQNSIFKDGYGIISKMVMRDRNIDVEAKAIYSYLCTYSGSGTFAFPSVELITRDLKIGKDRYYKYLKQLEEAGYIKKYNCVQKNGYFTNNRYEIVVNIK